MRKAYVQCQCDRCGRMAVVGTGPEGKPGDWRVLSLGGAVIGDLCPVCAGALHRWMDVGINERMSKLDTEAAP